jgi:hypothetical protein
MAYQKGDFQMADWISGFDPIKAISKRSRIVT